MKAMVLAAGYGTRFRPATYAMPKPMVPLCNRPLVGWVVDALVAFGVDEVVVNLHHMPDVLRAWLDREYDGRCTLHYSFEPEILGTGGGLRKCRARLEDEDVFLVVNADTVQFPPWGRLIDALHASGAPAAMLLRRPPRDDRFTGVWYDDGHVSSIGVNGEGESLMFAGVHAMTPDVFRHIPDRDASGLTEDLYAPLLEKGVGIGAAIDDGLWFDVGSPARYVTANASLLEAIASGRIPAPPKSLIQPLQQVLLHSTAVLEGLVTRSAVGEGSVVAGGCSVVDSALWSGVHVGEGTLVESSILADGVFVPGGSTVTSALVCRQSELVPPDAPVETAGELCWVGVDPRVPAIVRLGN